MGSIFISKCKANTAMFSKIAISACLLAVASAIPVGPPAPYHPAEPILPPVYNYEYGVNDAGYGPVFSQKESRDNYNTAGEYRVNLPDGRVQVVSYTAGPEGYIADVKYDGEAVYPEYKPAPAPYHPAPVYHKPAPYHAAPVYHPAPAPYKPRTKYTFKTVPAEAPAAKEAEAAPAEAAEAAPAEE